MEKEVVADREQRILVVVVVVMKRERSCSSKIGGGCVCWRKIFIIVIRILEGSFLFFTPSCTREPRILVVLMLL